LLTLKVRRQTKYIQAVSESLKPENVQPDEINVQIVDIYGNDVFIRNSE